MKNKNILLLFSAAVLLAVFFVGIIFGSVRIPISQIFEAIFSKANRTTQNIIFYSRIPRALSSILSGASLAVAGCVLQKVLSNKLASPGIIGVNSGAGFGVTLSYALGVISPWGVSLFAFCGSIFASVLILFISNSKNVSKGMVILGGVALNSILNAMSESISVLDSDVAILSTEFRVGGFSSVSYEKLFPAAIIILVSLFVLFTLSSELDVLSLGDDTATSVGLKVKKYRIFFLIFSSLLAGAAVSISGLLGFVGLIVPHFAQKIIGTKSIHLISFCAISGGAFVCLCDTLSRIVFSPYELPVGIIMSLIGGPIFVVLLFKMKRGAEYD